MRPGWVNNDGGDDYYGDEEWLYSKYLLEDDGLVLRVVVEEGGRPWMDILSKKTAKQIYKMESESGRKT